MDINQRIEVLKNHFKLSNVEFAEKIEVQPSTLSHIFSGRNRPSVDFILKIKRVFPTISLNWLLLGEGSMEEEKENKPNILAPTPTLFPTEKKDKKEKAIEKIGFFFKDGSFKIYHN